MTVIVWPEGFPFMAGAHEDPNNPWHFLEHLGEGESGEFAGNRERRAQAGFEYGMAQQFNLSSLLNRVFVDMGSGRPAQLISQMSGGTRQFRLLYDDGRKRPVGKGLRLVDPLSGEDFTVGNIFGPSVNRDFTVHGQELSEGQLKTLLGNIGLGGAGGVSADTAADIASKERIAAAQRALDLELDRLRTQREEELARIQEENANKRARLGEAGALARTAAEVQQRARQWLVETVGVDPTRAGISTQGGVQRGTTPTEAFRGQLQQTAAQPIPQVSESATLPEIEQVIGQLQGQQQLPTAPTLGLAYGGSINAGGMGIQQGTTKRGVLTGERNMDGDEEVVVMDTANPGHVEVVPLVSQAAEGGQYDASTTMGALAPIFARLGFRGDVPQVGRTSAGYFFGSPSPGVGGGTVARRLGYNPRLIHDVNTGRAYFRNPQGQLQHIINPDVFNQSGFRWSDVLNVGSNELGEFGPFGSELTAPPPLIEGPARQGLPPTVPLISPPESGSVALPSLQQLAGIWKYLDPQTQHVVASTYGVGGLGGGPSANPVANALAQIESAVRSYLPYGTARIGRMGALG